MANYTRIIGKASEELIDDFLQFRKKHACNRIDHESIQWEYINAGMGDPALLMLPGAFRYAESSFNFVRLFEANYHVIVPTYPPLPTVKGMMDGIINILNAEGVQSAYVLGQSYGGWMAQLLVRCHPTRFEKLVLSSTGPLTVTKRERLLLPLVLKLLPKISTDFVKKQLRKGFHSELLHFPAPEQPFWEAYSAELFERLTEADILSHFQVAKDAIHKGYMFNDGERSNWRGELLIIGSDNDPFVTGKDRDRLLQIYPQAQIIIIPSAGHIVSISEPEKYAEAIRRFLVLRT